MPWRGNVTQILQYQDAATPSSPLVTANHYDTAGNVVLATDPRSYDTTYDYNASTQFAYPNTITNPLSHRVTRSYFFNTGLVQSEMDPNGRTTTQTYDHLNRIKEVKAPDCVESCPNSLEYIYNDSAGSISIEEKTRLNNVPLIHVLKTHYDGLGRVKKRETSDPDAPLWVAVETQYDPVGRVSAVSNPYRTGSPLWTTTQYDGLSRVKTVSTPDGSSVTSLYVGPTLKVTDQAGKVRRSVVDALGRTLRVDEPINAQGAFDDGNGNPVQPTCYAYDELNNLAQVIQGPWNSTTRTCQAGQSRTFEYDSLSRLLSARNPEQVDNNGVQIATSFTYDENGNLRTRTDARGIILTYAYDPLNRLMSKTCSPTTEICTLTPPASYSYDATGVLNSVGRLTGTQYGTAAWTVQEYDALGRLKKEKNTLEGVDFLMEYEYDLAGNLTKMIYPSGKEVRYEYSTANRVGTVKNEMNRNYLAPISYSPHGGLTGGQYGNNLSWSIEYNMRLQPVRYAVTGAATVMDLTYNYVLGGNNGNVYRIDDAVGAKFYTYGYDHLNRIESATGNGQPPQSFYYDRYANLRKNNPDVAGWVYATTNRLVAYSFDFAGNQLTDGSYTYKYDAENRVVQVNAGAIAEYKYDAGGRRVVKVAANRRTFFIYSQAGQLLSEYDAPATGSLMSTAERVSPGFGQTTYQHPDHLGSPRVLTTQDQTVLERRDHSPFGEEITLTPNDQMKFTGKMRDAESGLDYFGARYYGSTLGRFMRPDPLLNSGKPWEPQSWNRYAYVENNPLRYTDPTGLFKWTTACDESADAACKTRRNRFRMALENTKKAAEGLEKGSKERKQLEKTLNRIGEEGKGSTKIAFGDAGTTNGQPNLARTNGLTITINFEAIDQTARGYGLNSSEAEALDAGVTGHEGEHIRKLLGIGVPLKGEGAALFVESAVYQGLHNTDRPFELWNESWAIIDKQQIEQKREKAIQNMIQRTKERKRQEERP